MVELIYKLSMQNTTIFILQEYFNYFFGGFESISPFWSILLAGAETAVSDTFESVLFLVGGVKLYFFIQAESTGVPLFFEVDIN